MYYITCSGFDCKESTAQRARGTSGMQSFNGELSPSLVAGRRIVSLLAYVAYLSESCPSRTKVFATNRGVDNPDPARRSGSRDPSTPLKDVARTGWHLSPRPPSTYICTVPVLSCCQRSMNFTFAMLFPHTDYSI
jgi:hypothetical protein